MQPFKRREDPGLAHIGMDNPAFDPLAILHALWNIDKHRHVNLAVLDVGYRDLFGPPPIPHIPARIDRLRFTLNPKGSFEDCMEFGTVSWAGGRVPPEIARHLNPSVFVSVRFEDGPPAFGASVTQTLNALFDEVVHILEKFERHAA